MSYGIYKLCKQALGGLWEESYDCFPL